ncbi:MAG TPA: diguanylate cyclase [Solirubrobacteraceae bacterium]|nr:diguanylate cyclase [Solirubrobacteraceae bacterium]
MLLAAQTRDIDVLARFGGEEFVALLPGCDSADAEAFTERVRLTLANDRASGLPSVQVSAGVCAALAPANLAALLAHADLALYEAKRAGRNRTVVASTPASASAPA